MDSKTLEAYNRDAVSYAEDWETQDAPTDLHHAVTRFFAKGPTADIGCGSGRDTAWLCQNGYKAVGYDASGGLLAEARRRHPEVTFSSAILPELEGVPEGRYTNVLCETVIMHLDPSDVARAVRRMLAILAPGGNLYLSWRITEVADRRDKNGRLYAAFDPNVVMDVLAGTEILLDEQLSSVSSGKVVRRIVARRS